MRAEPEPKVPTSFEREELQELIDRALEDDDKKGSDPKDFLYALIGVYTKYGLMMPPASRYHLKRMIVLHSEHVAPLNTPQDETFYRSLKISMHDQLKDFETIKGDDPATFPTPWRIALNDVLFYAVPEEDVDEQEAATQ